MTSNGKRILILGAGNLLEIGGVQRSYALLTAYLVKKGHEVILYGRKAYNHRDDAPLAYPLDPSVTLRFVELQPTRASMVNLRKMVRQDAPDVILIVNSSYWLIFKIMAVKCLRIPIVSSIRGSSEYCIRYIWPCRRLLELAFLSSSLCHMLMPSYLQPFGRAVRKKTVVIPSQIEPATSYANSGLPDENGRYIVLYSGRLSYEKRVDTLIKAFALCVDDFPEWDLWIYGTGPELDKTRQLVEDLSLTTRVLFKSASNTQEMYIVYPKCHLTVLPSEQEGCPMAMREAMSHGVPPIAFSGCSGANEIITHEKDGLLAQGNESEVELAKCMTTLMGDPTLRMKIGAAAKEKANQYKPDMVHDKWEKLILEAAKRKGAASIRFVFFHPIAHLIARLQRYIIRGIYDFRDTIIVDRPFSTIIKILFFYRKEYFLLHGRPLFDPRYYLQINVDVKKKGIDPLYHYISKGWKIGLDPSAFFSTRKYIRYEMEGKTDCCPLYHYYAKGRFSGSVPYPVESDYFEKLPNIRWKQMQQNKIADEISRELAAGG